MKSQYFLKDKKAQIYASITEGAENGRDIINYYPIAENPIWCYSKQLSQDNAYYSYHNYDEEARLFVFNYYKGVKVNDRILYNEKWYKITRVDTQDDYNRVLFIYAEGSTSVWGTEKKGNPKPYTPGIWENR